MPVNSSDNKKCRCCGAKICDAPLLSYHNMPALAQNFPDADELDADHGIDLDIYQCPACGLVQLLAEPVAYYRDVIRAVAVSADMRDFRRQYFKDFVAKCNLTGKRVIEIGAGCGEYMQMLECEDVTVSGIEHLHASVEKAKAAGLDVYEGFVESSDYEIPKAPYDAFYIMNFLEHIPAPVEFLKGIAANLADDAYGLVEVPNGEAIFKECAFSEFMLDHLSYFSKESLRTLLNLAGFEVISCEVIWKDYILSAIVKRRKTMAVEGFISREKAFCEKINTFIDAAAKDGRKVAVWGAGHESLANIALSEIAPRIDCVLDSADFKQNKYTPATHVIIVSPDEIRARDIGAIIVMCGSYSDEVLRIIHEKYPDIITEKFGLTV